MSTVLPTPAPPNRPILPPLAYGASRSMTLMPVSKISTTGFWSAKLGGSRWMDQRVGVSGCSPPSTARPVTLKSRPSVALPTGTVMAPPVGVTSMSRQRPSPGESRMQRTVLPPTCCATSIVHTAPSRVTSRASLMYGRFSSGNSTSTTGPRTCTILPFFTSLMFCSPSARVRRPPPR